MTFAIKGNANAIKNQGQNLLPKFLAIRPAMTGKKKGIMIKGKAINTSIFIDLNFFKTAGSLDYLLYINHQPKL